MLISSVTALRSAAWALEGVVMGMAVDFERSQTKNNIEIGFAGETQPHA